MIAPYKNTHPKIDSTCFIASSAVVIGDVEIGPHTSVWYGVVMRGDVYYIRIGNHSNIQDNAVCHVTRKTYPLIVGDYVTVGHAAVVHGCTIESHCLIGMKSVVMDDAVVGRGSIVAAGSVVPVGMKIPPRSLVAGVPARIKKELSDDDVRKIDQYAQVYLEEKEIYLLMQKETPAEY